MFTRLFSIRLIAHIRTFTLIKYLVTYSLHDYYSPKSPFSKLLYLDYTLIKHLSKSNCPNFWLWKKKIFWLSSFSSPFVKAHEFTTLCLLLHFQDFVFPLLFPEFSCVGIVTSSLLCFSLAEFCVPNSPIGNLTSRVRN